MPVASDHLRTDGPLPARQRPDVPLPGRTGPGGPAPGVEPTSRSAHEADTTALPVVVDVGARYAEEVRDHVEGVLGWQPVDVDTAPLVPPALWLVSPSSRHPGADGPRLLLLPPDADPVEAAEAGARHRTLGVIAWPSQRDRLEKIAARLLAAPRAPRTGVETVRVVGAGGGVGTSTVTLALAGLAAWKGSRVLAIVGPDAPVGEVRRVPGEALASRDLVRRASDLEGVAGARVVATDGGAGPLSDDLYGVDLVVIDGGVDAEGDVLVCRPDRLALERLESSTAGALVVNGDGPVPGRVLARAAGGRVRVELPSSARVARAVLHARVPASLPGAWLRRLLPVVPRPVVRTGEPRP